MGASELIAEVMRITQSPDHDDEDVLTILNNGMLEIAGGGDRPHGEALLAPLPDLFANDTVTLTSGSTMVALPDEYHRGVVRVEHEGEKLKRYDSISRFLDDYSGEAGIDPEAYCVKGNSLFVGPECSSDKELDVYFHRLPVDMTDSSTSTPDGLPPHLRRKLLVNYACKEIYSEIEQGLEGANPDIIKHTRLYQLALTDLERFIGPEDGEAANIGDETYTEE